MAVEKAISLPFKIDSFGVIGTTIDQSKIWADRVRSVLGTSLRERVMRPTLGTLIPYALFNDVDNATYEIKDEVQKAFERQLPLLTLMSVDVKEDAYTNTLTLTISYSLPNKEAITTTIGYISIQGNLPSYEELP